MLPEDKKHLELKAATVEAMRRTYLRAVAIRHWPSANDLWNEYARHLHEYRLMKRRLDK